MSAIEIIALEDMVGEKPQLSSRSTSLTLQAGGRQTGFGTTDFGYRFGARLDLVRDRVEKGRALRPAGIAVGPECLFCGRASAVDQIYCSDRKIRYLAMCRIVGEGFGCCYPFSGDQMLAMWFKHDFHSSSLKS